MTFRIGLEAPKGWPKCDGVHTSAVDRARNAIGNQAAWGYVIVIGYWCAARATRIDTAHRVGGKVANAVGLPKTEDRPRWLAT